MAHDIHSQLQQIQHLLVQLDLWAATPPPASAFESDAPFCIDTMTLAQWLQFVFLPRMQALLDMGAVLPTNVAISPLAEEVYKEEISRYQPLIDALKVLESCLAN